MQNFAHPKNQAVPSFSTPVKELDYLDIRGLSPEIQLMMVCLQGLVNRIEPRLLIGNKEEAGAELDEPIEKWPSDLGLKFKKTKDYLHILDKYKNVVKGFITYDTNFPHQINVATTIAGIEDIIPVTPELSDVLKSKPFNFKEIINISNKGLDDNITAYNYIFENYWDKCNKRIFTVLPPEFPAYIRDLAVAVKSAVVYLEPSVKEEKECFDKFFNNGLKADETYILGFWRIEAMGLEYISPKGISLLPSDYFENYTVYSGQSKEIEPPPVPAKPKLDKSKTYVSIYMSDGDNIQYVQHRMRTVGKWDDPLRGKYPVAWTISPLLIDAAPQILNYYMKTATDNDVFVCGPSGAGYQQNQNISADKIYWDDEDKNGYVEKYAKTTNRYLEKTNLSIITAWSKMTSLNKSSEIFIDNIPALLGVTTQHCLASDVITEHNKDVPMLCFCDGDGNAMSYNSYHDNEGVGTQARLNFIAENREKVGNFAAVQMNVFAGMTTDIRIIFEMIDELKSHPENGDKFEFVRADHQMMLINEFYGKPINIALRAKTQVSHCDAGYTHKDAVNGTFAKGWQSSSHQEKWLQVEFDDAYDISRYVIKNAGIKHKYSSSLNTKSCLFQTSYDGINWINADEIKDNKDDIIYKNVDVKNVRFARIIITDPGADGVARIQEFEVYGVISNNK